MGEEVRRAKLPELLRVGADFKCAVEKVNQYLLVIRLWRTEAGKRDELFVKLVSEFVMLGLECLNALRLSSRHQEVFQRISVEVGPVFPIERKNEVILSR